MTLTISGLNDITGHARYAARKQHLLDLIDGKARPFISEPHVLASFLAQVLHESGRLRYVKEVWGPTAAQRRYEGRRGLGNIQPGDGKRYMGRDIIQITGRDNYKALTKWVRSKFRDAPDFEKNPERLESPEWFGIGALWYWTNRVPAKYIEAGDQEMITRRVNGGLNGFSDRLELHGRAALVLLGFKAADVRAFQARSGLEVDGIIGPMTRAALHKALVAESGHTAPVRPDVPPPSPKPPTKPPAAKTGGLAAFFAAILALFGRKKT